MKKIQPISRHKNTWVRLGSFVAGLLMSSVVFATTVTFYTWRRQDIPLWDEINKKNLIPGITVNAQALDRAFYKPFVLLELQNGNADLFLWQPGASNLAELLKHNFIGPYTGKNIDNINRSSLLAAQGADGQYYGIPFAIQLQSVMVNKKLVNKHGINEQPSTLKALEKSFDGLKNAGITPLHLAGGTNWYISQVLSEVLMAGLVDEVFASQLITGESCFTDSQYQLIFDTLARWQKKGYLNSDVAQGNYTVMSKTVALGNSAMAIDGGWMASVTSDFYLIDPDYKFDFWAIPGVSNKIYALGDGTFQVGATSKQMTAAQQVLDFTTTKTFAELFASTVNELPAYGKPFYIKPGELKTMSEMVAKKSYGASLFTAYSLNQQSPNYNSLVIEAINGVLSGSKTPQEAAALIQSGLNSWNYVGAVNCPI